MKIEIELPDYDGNAMDVIWDDGAKYVADVYEQEIIIKADSRGLMSLAKQMIYMAVNNLPNGTHVHYDSFFTKLAKEKYELIIQKTEDVRDREYSTRGGSGGQGDGSPTSSQEDQIGPR